MHNMLRKNILNGLLALGGLGMLLVGYNSFVAKQDTKNGNTVASKFGSYLKFEQAKQETAEGQVAEVTPPVEVTELPAVEGVIPAKTPAAETPVVETPAPAVTPTPVVVAPAVPGAKAASTYVVKEGDTYGCIAEKYYGSFENWVDVDAANPNTEGFLERQLFIGTTLVLPALSSDQVKPASTLCS
jgi:LysM repeat protein